MAEMTINDVKYTNVPNKKAGTKLSSRITQSNIKLSQSVEDYMKSSYFYALVNALDIDWNGIDVGQASYINTTSDLINWIKTSGENTQYATMSYVNEKITELIGAAPETLDTLEELAAALQEDATLAYVTQALEGKANVNDVYTKNQVDTAIQNISLTPGPAGQDGATGADGLSAYQIAVNNGFEGDETAWLESLHGQDGNDGMNGVDGADGKSAYELAVDGGYEGTLSQWLESLHGVDGQNGSNGNDGNDGQDGLSAYEIAVNYGFEGDETAWLASLKGDTGTVDYSVLSSYVTYTDANSYYAAVNHTHNDRYLQNTYIGAYIFRDNFTYVRYNNSPRNIGNCKNKYNSSLNIQDTSAYVFIVGDNTSLTGIGGRYLMYGGSGKTGSNLTYVFGVNSFIYGIDNNAYCWYTKYPGYNDTSRNSAVLHNLMVGEGLKSHNDNQITLGKYNKCDPNTRYPNDAFDRDVMNCTYTLFVIGNGTSNSNRHNAFEVLRNCDIYIADTFNGTPYKLQDKLVHKSKIDSLKNVTISNVQDGQILSYNGTNWINSNIPVPDLSDYVSYTQATSYYATKEDIPDLSSYVSLTSYNMLVAKVDELSYLISYYHTPSQVEVLPATPDYSWTNSTINIDWDGGAGDPTGTNPNSLTGAQASGATGLTLTYSSNDTGIVEVDEQTGEITVVHTENFAAGGGSASITVSNTANASWAAHSDTYTIYFENYDDGTGGGGVEPQSSIGLTGNTLTLPAGQTSTDQVLAFFTDLESTGYNFTTDDFGIPSYDVDMTGVIENVTITSVSFNSTSQQYEVIGTIETSSSASIGDEGMMEIQFAGTDVYQSETMGTTVTIG